MIITQNSLPNEESIVFAVHKLLLAELLVEL